MAWVLVQLTTIVTLLERQMLKSDAEVSFSRFFYLSCIYLRESQIHYVRLLLVVWSWRTLGLLKKKRERKKRIWGPLASSRADACVFVWLWAGTRNRIDKEQKRSAKCDFFEIWRCATGWEGWEAKKSFKRLWESFEKKKWAKTCSFALHFFPLAHATARHKWTISKKQQFLMTLYRRGNEWKQGKMPELKNTNREQQFCL